jgi:hypothetical protein
LTTSAGDRSEGFYNKDGTLQVGKAKALARTYIKAAQGEIKNMHFDSTTGDFDAEIVIDANVKVPTEIHTFVNATKGEAWYAEGYDHQAWIIELKKAASDVKFVAADNTLSFMVDNKDYHGKTMKIMIRQKNKVAFKALEQKDNLKMIMQ